MRPPKASSRSDATVSPRSGKRNTRMTTMAPGRSTRPSSSKILAWLAGNSRMLSPASPITASKRCAWNGRSNQFPTTDRRRPVSPGQIVATMAGFLSTATRVVPISASSGVTPCKSTQPALAPISSRYPAMTWAWTRSGGGSRSQCRWYTAQ